MKNFNELREQVKVDWDDDARAVHDTAAVSFDAELAARAELGAMLARARADRQLTQPELSAASGVQQAEISRIERGISNPTAATLTRLANALGQKFVLQSRT